MVTQNNVNVNVISLKLILTLKGHSRRRGGSCEVESQLAASASCHRGVINVTFLSFQSKKDNKRPLSSEQSQKKQQNKDLLE